VDAVLWGGGGCTYRDQRRRGVGEVETGGRGERERERREGEGEERWGEF
jgi:hypothetical protein